MHIKNSTSSSEEETSTARTETASKDDQSVYFRHIDPNWQFYQTGGHIVNPQQTQILYQTFQLFDATVYR